MIKTTRLILILIFGFVFMGLITQKGPILVLAIPLIIYLGAGWIASPSDPELKVERSLSADRVAQGSPVEVRLRLTNLGPPIERLSVKEILPAGVEILKGSPQRTASLKTGGTLELNYTLAALRGVYKIAGYHLVVSDHLGLRQKVVEAALSSRFLALPATQQFPQVPIRPRNTRVFPGLIPARKGGPGVEFFGIREYQPGDPLRWVNDRLTARHEGTWYVNQFQQERAVDIGLILDCRLEPYLIRSSTELFEYATQAAATLAESFLEYGNRVGLLAYGGIRTWIQPGYGKYQRERILQGLAEVRLYDRMVDKELTHLPTRLFSAGAQLVLISALVFQDLPALVSLRAHGYPLLIISPDPIAFELQGLEPSPSVSLGARFARLERDHLMGELRRAGARVLEWQVEEPLFQVARQGLSHPATWTNRRGIIRA